MTRQPGLRARVPGALLAVLVSALTVAVAVIVLPATAQVWQPPAGAPASPSAPATGDSSALPAAAAESGGAEAGSPDQPALSGVAARLAGHHADPRPSTPAPESTQTGPSPAAPATVPPVTAPPATVPAEQADSGPTSVYPATDADAYTGLRDSTLDTLRRHGPARALRALDRAIRRQPELSGVCHAVAHDLGHATLERVRRVGRALAVRNDVCGGGYTHGVVEMALGSSRHVARDLQRVCAPEQDGSCFHGVGHGVMFASGYRVPRALALCDRAPGAVLSVRCGEGVFMQLFTLDDGAAHTAASSYRAPTPATARGICRGVRSPYDGACWFYAPTVWLQVHPDDWRGATRWCARTSAAGSGICMRGVGSRTVKYHPDELRIGAGVCARAPRGLVDDCLAGMGSYWSVHWKGQRARSDVCHRLGRPWLESRCRAVNA